EQEAIVVYTAALGCSIRRQGDVGQVSRAFVVETGSACKACSGFVAETGPALVGVMVQGAVGQSQHAGGGHINGAAGGCAITNKGAGQDGRRQIIDKQRAAVPVGG